MPIRLPLPLLMFSEMVISCLVRIPSPLQFSTPNKTLNTQPALSFHCLFSICSYSFVFPRIQLVDSRCLILQHRDLGIELARAELPLKRMGKKASKENPLWLTRYRKAINTHMMVICKSSFQESGDIHLVSSAWVTPLPSS